MKSLFFILCLTLHSCSLLDNESDDNLKLIKASYTGSELKTDGYYFMTYDFDPGKPSSPTFFYNNGIFLSFGCNYETELNNCINVTANNNWAKNSKSGWGLFKIEGASLYYERWYVRTYGRGFKVFSHECDIINDTTYIVKKRYRLVNGEQTEVTFPNYTYKFVEFANKPSSDNDFIP